MVSVGALTYRADKPTVLDWGDGYSYFTGAISLDTSYPSGGYDLPERLRFAQKFKTLKGVLFEGQKGYTIWYDEDNKKIKVYVSANNEISAGYDLSFLTNIRFISCSLRRRLLLKKCFYIIQKSFHLYFSNFKFIIMFYIILIMHPMFFSFTNHSRSNFKLFIIQHSFCQT